MSHRILPAAILAALAVAAPAHARPLPADPPSIAAHPRAEVVHHGFPWADAVAGVGVAALGATVLRRRRVAS